MAYFTRAQSNPQFPSNLPNPNYQYPDLGNTLDSVFNAYLQSKQMGMLESMYADERNQRANAETVQFGATLPTSPEQRLRAQAPLTQNQGPVQPGQAPLGQSGFDSDPSVAALQRAIEQHRSSQRMGQQEKALGMDVKRSEIIRNLRDPAALVKPEAKTYEAPDGKNRIGKWTPQGLVTSPDDPLAAAMSMPDKSEQAMMAKARLAAANARGTLKTVAPELDRLLELNKKTRAGVIGEATQRVSSALNLGQDIPEYKNTADVVNSLQAMVAKVLKSTFGGQLSDGEREYLKKVYGAAAGFTQEERRIAIETVRRMMQDKSSEADFALSELSAGSFTAGHSAPKQDHSALLDKYGAP